MDIDLIIFDLDGTLIDSKLDIANSVNYMLLELGLDRLDNERIYSFVGNGVGNLVKCALTEKHLDKFDAAMLIFRQYYSDHIVDNTRLYPGVIDILNHYSSKKRAVVTNKDSAFSVYILKHLSIFNYFDKIVCGDSLEKKKPDPCQINNVLAELKIDKERSLIVGDGEADIKAGKNASINTCGLTYGFGTRKTLEDSAADIIIDNIACMKTIYV